MKNTILFFFIVFSTFGFVNFLLVYFLLENNNATTILNEDITQNSKKYKKNEVLNLERKSNGDIENEEKKIENQSEIEKNKVKQDALTYDEDVKIQIIPENNAIFEEKTIFVEGRTISNVNIYFGNINTKSDEFGEFFLNINLVEGKNIFPVVVIDQEGNVLKETEIIYYYYKYK